MDRTTLAPTAFGGVLGLGGRLIGSWVAALKYLKLDAEDCARPGVQAT